MASDASKTPTQYGTLSESAKAVPDEVQNKETAEQDAHMAKMCWYICGFELIERIAFYTLSGTVVFHLQDLGVSLQIASATSESMYTLSFLWTIAAGWVADAWVGRFYTIVLAAALYCVGISATTVAAYPSIESKPLYLIGVLGVVPPATAGVKACLSVFGADQFDMSTEQGRKYQQRFFSWFFVAVNIGALIAFAFLVNFGQDGGLGVSQEMGLFCVYLLAGILMVFGLALFCSGANNYIYVPLPANGSALYRLLKPIFDAAKNGSYQAILILFSFFGITASLILSVINSGVASILAALLIVISLGIVLAFSGKPDWLDKSGDAQDDYDLSDTKGLLRLIPICLTALIAGLMAQSVMGVWYANQACQMDVRFGGTELSGSFFNIIDCLAVIIFTPVILSYVNPALERLIGRPLDYADKIYIGSAVGCMAMLSAAILEIVRRSRDVLDEGARCGPEDSRMSSLSAFWICIPYTITGISEIYAMPTILHLAYSKSPESMRTFSTMVVYFVLAIVSEIVTLVTRLMWRDIPDDLDQGHLEYLYLVFVSIALFFAAMFFIVDRDFRQQTEADEA